MPLTTFKKNETDIKTLAKRLYPDLDDTALEKVEVAIAKANPHLLEAGTIRPGIVVTLPKIPGIVAKPGAESNDPVDEIQKVLLDALQDFRKDTEHRMSQTLNEINAQGKIISDGAVRKAIDGGGPKAQELAGRLEQNIAARLEIHAREKQVQKDLWTKIVDDLKSLSQW